MEKITSYKQLKIWQKGMDISNAVYRTTKELSRSDPFSLGTQMRKAAVAIPIHIAAGFKKFGRDEYRSSLNGALAAAAELETLLVLAEGFQLIEDDDWQLLSRKLEEEMKMISGLSFKLRNSNG